MAPHMWKPPELINRPQKTVIPFIFLFSSWGVGKREKIIQLISATLIASSSVHISVHLSIQLCNPIYAFRRYPLYYLTYM